ncbi:MAG: MATE family efflux transporter [Beijerinckiaceae bacterium]|nr:MATE family efflux transporter [Beijerinckiaceae bacterium]
MNAPASPERHRGIFTEGSIMRHVVVMTATGSIGLMAIFVVDLLTLMYISWLADPHLTAAVGFAAQVSFFLVSMNIGLSIAVSALMAREIGSGRRERARRLCASGIVHTVILSGVATFAALPFRRDLLMLLGASGQTLEVADTFLLITMPANILMAVGMVMSGALRSVGDAKRSMYVTLWGAAVIAVLDPLLIFGFGLGVPGAAIATCVSRATFAVVGLWGAIKAHDLVGRPRLAHVTADLRPLMSIALPAIATNLAAPLSTAYALRIFAGFGEPVVAAFAIIDRLVPVAFGVLFALSGSVGPIIGQNLGAGHYARITRTLTDSFMLVAGYSLVVWALLFIAAPYLPAVFAAEGRTADLIVFFCKWGGLQWIFLGGLFVANAAFNNLGYAFLSTVFNWGRATLGTIPFVTLGAHLGGPEGGLLGMIVGAAIFGAGAIVTAYLITGRIAARATAPPIHRPGGQ